MLTHPFYIKGTEERRRTIPLYVSAQTIPKMMWITSDGHSRWLAGVSIIIPAMA
jgi:hypothetical protein